VWLLIGVLASGVATLGFTPGDSFAKGSRPAELTGLGAFFILDGRDGYEVLVTSVDDWVVLEARRNRVIAGYAVRGHVTAERIEARFGNLGRISVEFDPLRERRRRSNPCRRRSSVDIGFFRGRIQFQGEDGYTAVNQSGTIGLLFNRRPKRCGRHARARISARPRHSLNTHLSAISRRKGAVTSFELSRKRGKRRLSLLATREERRGGMQIFRRASTVVGGDNAFAVSGPGVSPLFAFIAAPKPLSGRAVFDASAAGSQWTGSLAAWLPGAGKVPLTGPDYAIGFCRRAAGEPGCSREPPVRKPFRLTQGSGSQSQLLAEARLSWSRYRRNSASSAGSTP
jgi:hypothetical protein